MMDEKILIGDLFEDFVGLVRSPQQPRMEHRVLERRPMHLGERRPIGKPHALGRPDDDVLADLEVLDKNIQHPPGHVGLDLEQRERAVAQLL